MAVKGALLTPAPMVNVAGTVTDALLLVTVTGSPPAGAALERVTVHALVPPEATDVGEQTSEDTVADVTTVNVAFLDEPFALAVSWALPSGALAATVAVKGALLTPAPTVNVAGTVTDALLLVTVTGSPPAGAALERVTVHALVPPEATDVGEQTSEDTVAGATRVKVVFLEEPFAVAVSWALPSGALAATVAVKGALLAPAPMVKGLTTVTDGLLLVNVTESAAGAALDRVTVHELVPPEATDVGEQTSEDTVAGVTKVKAVFLDEPFAVAVS
ncbi:MAG: hypothetical protein ACKV22_19125 [Bryobacteraceae bacterium]